MIRSGDRLSGAGVSAIAALMVATCVVFDARADVEPKIDARLAASIKAAYLPHLATFTKWPSGTESEGSDFRIGILGDDPHGVAENLEKAIREKKLSVRGQPLRVRRLKQPGKNAGRVEREAFAETIASCRILFVLRSESSRLPSILKHTRGRPILVVGEVGGMVHTGGMVEFFVALRGRGKSEVGINMRINIDAARREGLKFNSNLLRLRWVEVVREKDAAVEGPRGKTVRRRDAAIREEVAS